MITLLVLNYNDSKTTLEFIEKHINYDVVGHVVVVDNFSSDSSYEKLCLVKNPKLDIIRTSENNGYGSGNNFGIKWIQHNYGVKRILLANPDVIIEERVLISLDAFMQEHEDAVIAAPYMLNADGEKMPNTAFKIPTLWQYMQTIGLISAKYNPHLRYDDLAKEPSGSKEVGAVSGSCFMLDVEKFLSFGGFDEQIFLYCEEIVIGIKARNASYKLYLLPNETFIHNHSVSISQTYKSQVERQKLLYESKLYVIKTYFTASKLQLILSRILTRIALLEYFVKESLFKK